MTAQVPETIVIDGKSQALCALPLAPLFDSWSPPPLLELSADVWSSCNSREYRGTWEILGSKLYLTNYEGTITCREGGDRPEVVVNNAARAEKESAWRELILHLDALPENDAGERMADQHRSYVKEKDGFMSASYEGGIGPKVIMNASNMPLFASWYSGMLRVPQGKELNYVHGGFGSLSERDLIIAVESGVVIRRWTVNYISAFEKNAYSLFAMDPEIQPGGGERALRYMANPFIDDAKAAVSEIFRGRMVPTVDFINSGGRYFFLFALVKAVIRTRIIDRLGNAAVLSVADRQAREEYNQLVDAFQRKLDEAAAILHREKRCSFSMPDDPEEVVRWSMKILSDPVLYEEEHFLRLRVAHLCLEFELRSQAKRGRSWWVE